MSKADWQVGRASDMDRKTRRALRVAQDNWRSQFTPQLRKIPIGDSRGAPPLAEVSSKDWVLLERWVSRRLLVNLYAESRAQVTEDSCFLRMVVHFLELRDDGNYREGLTWDDLQEVKRQIGRGDWCGYEVYPRDRDVINNANLRHIWLLPKHRTIGWVVPNPGVPADGGARHT